ncbi:type II 3-dehydroquinate dehydratase [Jannaschia sp. Os4]|uniref:type II 3-dehydroquinate dehydratase n=1 Tax=Jannaschia sp. Os4 TaxID=2807617 RepID=UPI00193A5EAF|nr:type II 3-dehydroquinate dehydratase [Jannaschia sp. Os4]MBM2575461.1 type II 3-dehydroquinate dehydratase [Jannaschia sp. Os4]
MPTLLLLNGPNLNLLGQREPHLYGADTLEDVARLCREAAPGWEVREVQSNHEGALIDAVHAARGACAGIVVNPGAYSHTSIALLDALNAFEGPVMEVHVTNIHRRETFRHRSYVSLRADGVIAGLGVEGYAAATRRIVQLAG